MSGLLQRAPHRIRPDASRTPRRLFVPGQETLIRDSALFNPSMVAAIRTRPGCQPGEARFIITLRAVGEGHMSSIEFRTGTIGESGIRLNRPGRFPDNRPRSARSPRS